MPKIGVIISMLNLSDLTDKCVNSVIANAGIDCDIVVVDDGSTVPYSHAGVEIIRYEKPNGNTHSINAGIKFFDNKYDYIMNLDNDIELAPNAIKELVDVMEEQPSIALAGSLRILYQDDKEIKRGDSFDLLNGTCASMEAGDMARLCFWVSGCSVLIRSSVIQEIGMFDKRLMNYCQDSEWCLRAITKGYDIAVVPKSVAYHVGQITMHSNKIALKDDQRIFMDIIGSAKMRDILECLPLSLTDNLYGRISFDTFNKPAATELT